MQYPGYPPPPGMYNPPPPPRSGGFPTWAIVLLASLGVFLVLGVAAVLLAVTGMRSFIAASKTAEATNTIGQISRDSIVAYEREDYMLGGAAAHRLCGSASHPVPRYTTSVMGMKYQSSSADWGDDSMEEGWNCLDFELFTPQYYQYDYTRTGTGKSVGDTYSAEARGDLDGDGIMSSFVLKGKIVSSGTVIADPTPTIKDEKE